MEDPPRQGPGGRGTQRLSQERAGGRRGEVEVAETRLLRGGRRPQGTALRRPPLLHPRKDRGQGAGAASQLPGRMLLWPVGMQGQSLPRAADPAGPHSPPVRRRAPRAPGGVAVAVQPPARAERPATRLGTAVTTGPARR